MLQNDWLDGTIADPAERYRCFVFDAVFAAVGGGELLGGLFGAGEVAADIGAGTAAGLGAADAAITLPELAVTATAPEALGAGAAAADVAGGAGALGAGGALGADIAGAAGTTPSGGLNEALSGAGPADTLLPSGIPGGGATAVPAVGPPQPPPLTFAGDAGVGSGVPAPLTTAAPTAPVGTASPAAVTGGPVGTAPAAPTAAGPQTFAETGITPGDGSPAGGGDYGGGGDAAVGSKSSGGFLDRLIGPGTGADLKDAGSILSPIASIGGLGLALMNSNKPIPGQSQLAGLPGVAANTARTAGEGATAAATKAATDAAAAGTSIGATASGQVARGETLENFVNTGQLPPGLAGGIRQAAEAAKASIRSQYAQRGMSGSSAEAQDLQAAEERAATAGGQVAIQLLQQGASMVGAGTSEAAQGANLSLSGGSLAANTAISAGGLDLNAESLANQIYTQIMNEALQRDQQLGSAIGSFASALAGGNPSSITLKAA